MYRAIGKHLTSIGVNIHSNNQSNNGELVFAIAKESKELIGMLVYPSPSDCCINLIN